MTKSFFNLRGLCDSKVSFCYVSTVYRYNGWQDAVHSIWKNDGFMGFWKGSLPRVVWYLPACALTFMSWQAMRNVFIKQGSDRTMGRAMEHSSSIEPMPSVVPHSSQARWLHIFPHGFNSIPWNHVAHLYANCGASWLCSFFKGRLPRMCHMYGNNYILCCHPPIFLHTGKAGETSLPMYNSLIQVWWHSVNLGGSNFFEIIQEVMLNGWVLTVRLKYLAHLTGSLVSIKFFQFLGL